MNNKYLKMALGLPLFIVLLGGCLQENDCPDGDTGTVHRLLGISSLTASIDVLSTRAVASSVIPQDAEVGFFVQADMPFYTEVNNRKGTYNLSENRWLPIDDIWLTGIPAKITVYYPYDALQTTAEALKLAATVRTDDTKDLWSVNFQAGSNTPDIFLTLKQLYTRLCVTFVKVADKEYTGEAALTRLELAGENIYAAATFNLKEEIYLYNGFSGYAVDLTGVNVKGTDATAPDATKVDLLLPPYRVLTEDITLTVTIDGKAMKITVPKERLDNTLASGKQYNLLVKLKPMALVLGAIRTMDWDSQTAWEEEVTFAPTAP